MTAKGFIWLLLLLLFSTARGADAVLSAPEQAKLLTGILDRTARAAAEGKSPAAAFDIDDTLLLTSPRSKAILQEYCRLEPEPIPGFKAKVEALEPDKMPHGIVVNLIQMGVGDPEKRKEIVKFWRPRFMGAEFLDRDWVVAGALEYIGKLRKNGATVYYVTARPDKTMRAITEKALRHFGFPVDAKARLVMNLENQAAPPFKGRTMDEIEKTHVLTGLFENEPDNLNAMHRAAPAAQPVFLQTIHSAGAGPLDPGIPRVRDYKLGVP